MSDKIKKYLEENVQLAMDVHKMDTVFNEVLMEAIQDDAVLTYEDKHEFWMETQSMEK